MAAKTDLSKLNCSLAGALSIVGDWWSLLILRDALLGAQRFAEFQKSLGLARNILADRLKRLTEDGVLVKAGTVQRPIYSLTDKGRALAPAIIALMQWGDRWVSKKPPVVVTDQAGREIDPIIVEAGGRRVSINELRFKAGRGAAAETEAFLKWLANRIDQRT